MPSADFCPAIGPPHGAPSRRSDTEQISWGKLSRLPRTVAESTLRPLDGYGLRGTLPARPVLAPCIRFLSIDSRICLVLPSDPASRRQPLHIASPSPPSGWAEDFHLQTAEHAQHTTNPLPRECAARSRAGGKDRANELIEKAMTGPASRPSASAGERRDWSVPTPSRPR
jgi:hypothetical protein